jgi:hypothetical protein
MLVNSNIQRVSQRTIEFGLNVRHDVVPVVRVSVRTHFFDGAARMHQDNSGARGRRNLAHSRVDSKAGNVVDDFSTFA